MSVRVIEIRSEKVYLVGSIKWSANASDLLTNSNVNASMQFSQPISAVQVPSEYVDSIEVLINGTIVSVRYDGNSDAIRLKVVATNGTYTTVELAAVTNIDKDAPVISLKSQTLSDNGREVTVTLHSNEKALFAQKGNYGEEVSDGYDYTFTVKANGTYTYIFTDMASNITTIDVSVEGIVDSPLVMEFSKDGVSAVTDPLALSLDIGDTVYVRTNRDSKVDINGGEKISAAANTWVELTVSAGMTGLWPIIRAEDKYGNVVLGQLGQVKLPDVKAPVVDLKNNVVVVKVGADAMTIDALLKANVIASDIDPNLTITLDYDMDINNTGSASVIYKVSDSSGNVGIKVGVLRIVAENEPVVKVNNDVVVRDTIYVAKDDVLNLTVETLGEPYTVVYKSGLKSVGQMKIGVTNLAVNATTADEIVLPFEESGYYTVCIVTQSRDYYRIQIYVE